MNAKCHYASRKQCNDNSVFQTQNAGVGQINQGGTATAPTVTLGPHWATGPRDAEAGTPTVAETRDQELIENPCILVPGYAKGPRNTVVDSTLTDADGKRITFKGTGLAPRAYQDFFRQRRANDINYQMMEVKGVNGNENTVLSAVTLQPAGGEIGTRTETSNEFNVLMDQSKDPIVPYTVEEDAPYAVVENHLGETDLHYLAERMIYDVLLLSELAESVDRGQEFWNKLDARCFNDGITSETHIGILISGILIGFVTLGTLQKSFGVVNCFPFIDACKGSMGITWLNINNYVLAIFGGLLGLVASYGWGGFAVESGDHNNDLLQWARNGIQIVSPAQEGFTAEAATYSFLNDLSNGDFHHAIDLTSGEAAAIHALTAMSLCILVVASFKTTVKSEEKSDGTYDGWENPGALLKA